MQLVVEFVKERKLNQQSYDEINHVRMYKQMILPTEIVRARRRKLIEAFDNIEAKSLL